MLDSIFIHISGEHAINGRHYPLEAHFIHYACDDENLLEAIENYQNSSDPDHYVLSVVAIMFEISEENNPAFDVLLNNSTLHRILNPDDLSTPNITGYDIVDNLNLNDLIPPNLKTEGYYAYEGSLSYAINSSL